MTKEEKRIELAKIDGWIFWSKPHYGHDGCWHSEPYKGEDIWATMEGASRWAGEPKDIIYECQFLPLYLESYDAMLRLIQKLPHSQIVHICDIANPGGSGVRFIQKTPEELGDAVLRSTGKWLAGIPPK